MWKVFVLLLGALLTGEAAATKSIASSLACIRPFPRKQQEAMQRRLRNLQMDQCLSDTITIYDSSRSLQDAADAFDSEYDAAVEACGNRRSCTIDEDTFEATPGFVRECEAAGGVIYEYDMEVFCTLNDEQESVAVKITYLNVDNCYAPQSCDENAVAEQSEQDANADLNEFEEVFSSESVTTVCNIAYTVSDSMGNLIVADKIEGSSSPHRLSLAVGGLTMAAAAVASRLLFL